MKLRICAFPVLLALALTTQLQCPVPTLRKVSVTPARLTFAPRMVGSGPSAAQTVTLKNTSGPGVSVSIGNIRASGDYAQSSDCPSTLGSGASCHIEVSFDPTFVGTILGGITISDNALGNPQLVSLSGTGSTPVAFSPNALNFGTVPVGTNSGLKTVTVTNRQSTAISITGISTSGDYHQVNNCSASLLAGATCTVSILFHPTLAAAVPGALRVATNAVPGTQPVGLSGIGSGTATSTVSFSPASLNLGSLEAGTLSGSKVVTVRNTSTSTSLSVFRVVPSSPNYHVSNNCVGTLIAPNGTCTINVSFQPAANFATISYPGAITVADSASSSPQVIGLAGQGVPPVTSSPALVNFGERGPVIRDPDQNTKTVTLTNRQQVADTLTLTSSAGFTLMNNRCTSLIPAGGKCTFDVQFRPLLIGTNNGAVTVTPASVGPLRPEIVSMTGCGTPIDLSTYVLNFGSEPVGSATAALAVAVTNFGSNTVTINRITISGTNAGDFGITQSTCGSSLAGNGAYCAVSLAFKPTAVGSRSSVLNISDTGACSPQKTTLLGTGT